MTTPSPTRPVESHTAGPSATVGYETPQPRVQNIRLLLALQGTGPVIGPARPNGQDSGPSACPMVRFRPDPSEQTVARRLVLTPTREPLHPGFPSQGASGPTCSPKGVPTSLAVFGRARPPNPLPQRPASSRAARIGRGQTVGARLPRPESPAPTLPECSTTTRYVRARRSGTRMLDPPASSRDAVERTLSLTAPTDAKKRGSFSATSEPPARSRETPPPALAGAAPLPPPERDHQGLRRLR